MKTLLFALTIVLAAPALADEPYATQTDPIVRIGDGVWVGESTLLRFANRIQAIIRTGDLDPGAAVTVWWRIYNRPQNCAVAFACEASDLDNPAVDGSQLHASAFAVDDADGSATVVASLYRTSARIPGRGRFRDSLPEGYLRGSGLRLPKTAEIELLVANHGRVADRSIVGDEAALAQLLTPTGTQIDCLDPSTVASARGFRCGVIQRVDHSAGE